MQETDYSSWFSLESASKEIGRSTKQVQRYASQGRLARVMWLRPDGVRAAAYRPNDVDKLKSEISGNPAILVQERPLRRKPSPSPPPVGIPQLFPEPNYVRALLAATPPPAPASTLFLTPAQASGYSGLPEAYIRRQVKAGGIPAIRSGGLYIRKKDLEAL